MWSCYSMAIPQPSMSCLNLQKRDRITSPHSSEPAASSPVFTLSLLAIYWTLLHWLSLCSLIDPCLRVPLGPLATSVVMQWMRVCHRTQRVQKSVAIMSSSSSTLRFLVELREGTQTFVASWVRLDALHFLPEHRLHKGLDFSVFHNSVLLDQWTVHQEFNSTTVSGVQ